MRIYPRYLTILAIIFAWDVSEAKAYSCFIAPVYITGLELLERSEAVFAGQVDRLTELDTGFVIAHITLDQQWKGGLGKQVDVYTRTNSCGYPFKVGQKYLLFTHERDNQLHTDICKGTAPLEHSLETVAEFELEAFERGGCGNPLMPTVLQTFFWVGLARVTQRSLQKRTA